MKHIYLAIFAACILSCVAEGDRKLNEQNHHAGNYIAGNSTDPAIVQAGKDVAANAQVVAVGIGVPKQPTKLYSPKISAQARAQAKEEHEAESGIFTWIKTNVAGNLPWGGAVMGALGAIFALSKKLISNKRKFVALYSGAQNIINAEDTEERKEAVIKILRDAAVAGMAYNEIKSDVLSLKKKGIIKSA